MHSVEVVYNGRDNSIDLELRENGVNLADYTPITRVLVIVDGTQTIDSAITGQYFDWLTANKLVIKAGLTGINPGSYTAKLITFDSDNTNGIVWTEALRLVVKA